MSALLIAVAVAAAAFVKGSIGFGFPTLGTPPLTLIVDVKTAFLVLIIPEHRHGRAPGRAPGCSARDRPAASPLGNRAGPCREANHEILALRERISW